MLSNPQIPPNRVSNTPQIPQFPSSGMPAPMMGAQHMATGGSMPQFRKGYDAGGPPSMSQMAPWYTRAESRDPVHVGGLFGGSAPGRSDTLPVAVGTDSHILPADVISGMGDGNSLAGAHIMDKILSSGPHGIPLQHVRAAGHLQLPNAPRALSPESTGGRKVSHENRKTVPIAASSGEYNVPAQGVYKIGMTAAMNMKLDPHKLTPRKIMDIGHDTLDKLILEIRKRTIKTMSKLPGPKKD